MTSIAIVGSRQFARLDLVADFVASLPPDVTVISGGAGGVDTAAEEAAKARGLAVQIFPADWARHGRAAGPIRNVEIVEAADELVAWWDGASRGTLNSVALAHRRGIPIRVFGPAGEAVLIGEALAAADRIGVTAAIERNLKTTAAKA